MTLVIKAFSAYLKDRYKLPQLILLLLNHDDSRDIDIA